MERLKKFFVVLTDVDGKRRKLVIWAADVSEMFNEVEAKYGHLLVDEQGHSAGNIDWINDWSYQPGKAMGRTS